MYKLKRKDEYERHFERKATGRKETHELKMMPKFFVWMTGSGIAIGYNGEEHGVEAGKEVSHCKVRHTSNSETELST